MEFEEEEYIGEYDSYYEGEALGRTEKLEPDDKVSKASSIGTDYEPEDGQGDCIGYCDSESDNSNWNLAKYNEMFVDDQLATCMDELEHGESIELTIQDIVDDFYITSDDMSIAQLQMPGNIMAISLGRRVHNKDILTIAEAIPDMFDIKTINLAYNEIDDDGADALGALLQDYSSISRLNLMHNNLTSKGIWTLVSYLIRRPALYQLKLAGMKFGDELGVNALICLIMAGCCPHDLDIGECDMSMEALQALCTAWYAIDHDINFPLQLREKKLPVSLDELAKIKKEQNRLVMADLLLDERKGQIESMTKAHEGKAAGISRNSEGHHNKGQAEDVDEENCLRMTSSIERLMNSENEVDQLFLEYVSTQTKKNDTPQDLFTEFSSNLLEGLFSIPPPESAHSELTAEEILEYEKSKDIIETSKTLPDNNLLVEKFQSMRKERQNPDLQMYDKNEKPVFVDSSLYMLDVHDDPEYDFRHMDRSHQVKHENPLYVDFLLSRSGKEALHDDEDEVFGATDETSAANAAVKVTAEVLISSAQVAGATQYPDENDITQLLLMVVLDTVEQLSKIRGDGNVFTEEMVYNIIEDGVGKVERLLFPRLPSDCRVTLPDLRIFVKNLFVNTQSTFQALFSSPFIAETLIEACSVARREQQLEKEIFDKEASLNHPATPLNEEQVRIVCINFLDGAIKEAARIIGVGDPFGHFHQSQESNPDQLEPQSDDPEKILERVEEGYQPTMDLIFEESAKLAVATKNTVTSMEIEDATYSRAGHLMLEDVFADVLDAVTDVPGFTHYEDRPSDPLAPKKYKYISRPIRLVLNRPLFSGNEELIAAKLAHYLKKNSSVKIIHLRKWGLGEDGTQVLMDGLLGNLNIVTLDLGSNQIGPEGAIKVAEYVSKSSNLKHLLLNHNQLRNPGIRLLADALLFTNLVTLDVSFNDVDPEALDEFLNAVGNTKIQALYIIGNKFGQNTWKILEEKIIKKKVHPNMIDIVLQVVDGEGRIVKNAQCRNLNEWYEVGTSLNESTELELPPYFNVDVESLRNPFPPVIRGHKEHSRRKKPKCK